MTMTSSAQMRYSRDAVLAASPAGLVTMLYDRMLLDLHRAAAAQEAGQWEKATTELLHAQEIVAELASSLRVDLWDGAEGLLALYAYASNALRSANVNRQSSITREVLAMLEPLAEAWHFAADTPVRSAPAHRAGVDLGVA